MKHHLTKALRIFVCGCLGSVGYLIDEALEALSDDDDDEPAFGIANGAEEFLTDLRRDYHDPNDIAASQACEAEDCYWCWAVEPAGDAVAEDDADEDAEPQ